MGSTSFHLKVEKYAHGHASVLVMADDHGVEFSQKGVSIWLSKGQWRELRKKILQACIDNPHEEPQYDL